MGKIIRLSVAFMFLAQLTVAQSLVDVTELYLTNPQLRTSTEGWSGDMPTIGNDCAEYYERLFDIYQEVTVPNGKYEVKVTGFQRPGVNDSGAAYAAGTETRTAYLYANSEFTTLMSLYAVEAYSAGISGLNGYANGMGEANTAFNAGLYADNSVSVIVTNGTLRVGLRVQSSASYYWSCFRDFQIYFSGEVDVLDTYITNLNGLLDEADALLGNAMQGSVLTALQQAMTKGDEAITTATVEAVTAAITALSASIENAEKSIAVYSSLYDGIAVAKQYYVEGVLGDAVYLAAITAAEEAYNNHTATELSLSALQDATATFFANNRLDGLLVNADMESGTTGWVSTFGTIATGDSYPGFGGTFQERWTSSGGTLSGYDSYQEITGLPNGSYTFTSYCVATNQAYSGEQAKSVVSGVYLYANDDVVAVATLNEKPELFTVTTTVTDGTLRVGFRNDNNCTANWIAFDNVALYSFDSEVVWAYNYQKASNINPLDVTRFITNPSFEEDGGALSKALPKGWTALGYTASCNWYGVNAANGNDDRPTDGNYLFGVWDASVQSAGISQQVKDLPVGIYRLTVDMLASNRDNGLERIGNQCLFAGTDTAFFKEHCEVMYGDNGNLQTLTLKFSVTDQTVQPIRLGVNTADAPNETWFKVDNFTLAYLGTYELAGYDDQFYDYVADAQKLIRSYPYVFGAARLHLDSLMYVDITSIASMDEFQLLLDDFSVALSSYTYEMIEAYSQLFTVIEEYAGVEDLAASVDFATDVLVSGTATIDEVKNAYDELMAAVTQYQNGTLNLSAYLEQLQALVTTAESMQESKKQVAVNTVLNIYLSQAKRLLEDNTATRAQVETQLTQLSTAIEQATASVAAYALLYQAIGEATAIVNAYGNEISSLSAALETANTIYIEATSNVTVVNQAADDLDYSRKLYVKERLTYKQQVTTGDFSLQGGKQLMIVSGEARTLTLYSINGKIVRLIEVTVGTTTVNDLETGIYVINGHKIIIR